MERVYAKAAQGFIEIDSIDPSTLNNAMVKATQNWLYSKSSFKCVFNKEIESLLTKDNVWELYKNIMNQEYKKLILD